MWQMHTRDWLRALVVVEKKNKLFKNTAVIVTAIQNWKNSPYLQAIMAHLSIFGHFVPHRPY